MFTPTPEQEAILAYQPGVHARILAGPGTGKSTTVVALLDKLLQQSPDLRIRMLTFTRAATAELADKVEAVSGEALKPSTVHSFAISVLLQNPGSGGFPEPLRIADSWETDQIVHATLRPKVGVTKKVLKKLEREMAANWESLSGTVDREIRDEDRNRYRGAWHEHRQVFGYTMLSELPYALHRALEAHDDLRGLNLDLLVVDEYQDLNACDLGVLKLVCEASGASLIGTGDDDQSIYSWRNAAPEGIRRFLDDFAGAEDHPLTVSRRCGKRIIEWANFVIQGDHNRPRGRGVLQPQEDDPDGNVALLQCNNGDAEAETVAQIVHSLVADGMEPKDVLVLVRTDHNRVFSRPIRERIEARGIECSDPSAVVDMLAHPSNRELLECIRLMENNRDSLAWASLLHLCRGVGHRFIEYIYTRAARRGATFADELHAALADGLPDWNGSSHRVTAMVEETLQWLDAALVPETQPDEGWGNWIVNTAHHTDFLPDPTEDFVDLLTRLDERATEQSSLSRFHGLIEPLGKDMAVAESNGVRIMTMGMAKGLTVRAAIVSGVDDCLIPRPGEDLSEERRLLYVAMTRAKEHLYLTWATRRSGPSARAGGGTTGRRLFSRFLAHGPVRSQAV